MLMSLVRGMTITSMIMTMQRRTCVGSMIISIASMLVKLDDNSNRCCAGSGCC